MIRKATLLAALVAAALLVGCGTSTEDSRYQDQHGIARSSRYPQGEPRDSGSPALAATPEPAHSKEGPKTAHPGEERAKEKVPNPAKPQ